MEIISENILTNKNIPINFKNFYPCDEKDLAFYLSSGEFKFYNIKINGNKYYIYGSCNNLDFVFGNDKEILFRIIYDQNEIQYFINNENIKIHVQLVQEWIESSFSI